MWEATTHLRESSSQAHGMGSTAREASQTRRRTWRRATEGRRCNPACRGSSPKSIAHSAAAACPANVLLAFVPSRGA